MGASTGIAMESIRYACGHNLPIIFVIEDNGLSVKTDTREAWGKTLGEDFDILLRLPNVLYYQYKRKYPHAGTGVFVIGTAGCT